MIKKIETFDELQDKLMRISLSFKQINNQVPPIKGNKWVDWRDITRIGEPGVYEVVKDGKKKKLKVSYNFQFESNDFEEIFLTIKTLREMDLKINQEK